MKKGFIQLFFAAILIFSLISCEKDAVLGEGDAAMQFQFKWGSTEGDFKFDSLMTHPKTGEEMEFSMFKFYISNIKLLGNDGKWWEPNDNYYIIDATSLASSKIMLSDIPEGSYTKMSYTLGVDSIRNVSGAQTGALDVANGMFWSWNSGYIMVKAEGTSQDSLDFQYHLGGFSGANNIVTERVVDIELDIVEGKTPTINMIANAAKLWHSIDGVEEIKRIHMPGANAVKAASDFYGGIRFVDITN